MKKLFFILLSVVLLSACESADNIQDDIKMLKAEREDLRIANDGIRSANEKLRQETLTLMDNKNVIRMMAKGQTPRYILKLRLKQSHVTLDIGKHLKDEMNAIEFELPVDKVLYDSVTTGSSLLDEFRKGSFFTSGSIGSWEITVIDKRIL